MKNKAQVEKTIDRWRGRGAEREQVFHLLVEAGVAANSKAMLEILQIKNIAPQFVADHIQVWHWEGRMYGVGTIISRIKNGWQPNLEKMQLHNGAVEDLMKAIEAEEEVEGRPLTGPEIFDWFGSYRQDCPDYFDQLVRVRGGRVDENEIRRQSQVPRELEHLIQR